MNPAKRKLIALLFLIPSLLVAQTAKKVEGVALTVSDLDEAIEFYTEVLPFEMEKTYSLKGDDIEKLLGDESAKVRVNVAELTLGNESIELWEFEKMDNGRMIPRDSRSNDQWFQHIAIVVSDMDSAYKLLRNAGVTHVSSFPQTLPDYLPAAAGIKAFYFRDHDGHNLELIFFLREKEIHVGRKERGNYFLE